jgi:TldD protein
MPSLNDETSLCLFYNSEGQLTYDYRPMVSFSGLCHGKKGDKIENGYAARSFRKGFEWLDDNLVNELAKEAVDKTNIFFEATKPKAGEMPVVMGAGGSGILLHEAIGHTFEADFNRKGTSIFSDKMGKKVAESFINIIDDGTLKITAARLMLTMKGTMLQKPTL